MDTIPECDRQTDISRWHSPRYSYASRGKHDAKWQTFKRDNSASNEVGLVGDKYDGQSPLFAGVTVSSRYHEVVHAADDVVEAVWTVDRVDEQQRVVFIIPVLLL